MKQPHINRPLIFLGGIFTAKQHQFIENNSRGVVQNAADALQKKILMGLIQTYPASVTVLNLPFVGSYPRFFNLQTFPASRGEFFHSAPVVGQSFLNMRFIKSLSRLTSSFSGLLKTTLSRDAVVLIYSAHMPFLAAALVYRLIFRRIRICLILPDFPEFMSEGGWKYRAAKWVEARMFYAAARYVDRFVLLTRFMAERLKLENDRFTVVEGIASPSVHVPLAASGPLRTFLYTGTLAARYGINELVAAFHAMSYRETELWICGEGDSRERVAAAAAEDPRIKFFGQVSRERAEELQRQAIILVNPRPPGGEFTKYSFPSKTMEYLAAGRPVVMHKLAGIPEEYFRFIINPDTADVRGLAAAMDRTASLSEDELASMGAAGREFVLTQKNTEAQGRKISDLLLAIP